MVSNVGICEETYRVIVTIKEPNTHHDDNTEGIDEKKNEASFVFGDSSHI